MSNRRVLLFINPVSGKGRAGSIALRLSNYGHKIGVECIAVEPASIKQVLPDLSRALELAKYDALVVIGGDGLVHSAIQLACDNSISIYVVPAGTGNDVARSNELLTISPNEIFKAIYEQMPTTVDLGAISYEGGERKYCQILSTGFDAQVNERANRNRVVTGKMKYNYATLVEINRFKPINYELDIDGATRKLSAMLVAIANAGTYGGGMKLCPMADRQDGYLDIMILHPVSKIELLKVFPKVYSGKHVTHPAVEFLRCKKIKLVADTVAYADGERVGELPISVEIRPQSLRTWALQK